MKNKLFVRTEVSPLATKNISGIGSYTKALAEALDKNPNVNQEICYLNFLNRQPVTFLKISKTKVSKNFFMPLRIYSKLNVFGFGWPLDLFKKRADLAIFTNFVTWPTFNAKIKATTIHDLTYLHYPETVEKKNLEALKKIVPKTIENADLILTVSETIKNEIIKEFGVEPSRIIVTYNTADAVFKIKKNITDINNVKEKYKIPYSKYIFFMGNFEPRKNMINLIKAYENLPKTIKSEYGLVLAGGKGWKSEMAQQELELSIKRGNNIKHVGYIESSDAPALYQGASVFVFPSIYEGFGIPILEAMESDVPVVTSDIEVLRETAGKAAMYFDPSDPKSIAKSIESILTDQKLTKNLIEKGKENLKRFSWDNNIAELLAKVKALIDKQ